MLAHLYSSNSDFLNHFQVTKSNFTISSHQILDPDIGCKELHSLDDPQEKCSYVKTHRKCQSGGYISYLLLFYCTFNPLIGYTVLTLWLVILFYLLGDTSSNYFCPSLEGLSKVLKLSPTIAGATLLSLGNGAPDIFSSIVSFMGDGTKDVGLNSILGGSFFVSTTVVGIISIAVSNGGLSISRFSFMRDLLFFLLSLSCLLLIIVFGKINLWGAFSFLSLYFIYVALVSASQMCKKEDTEVEATDDSSILPVSSRIVDKLEGSSELGAPLLGCIVDDRFVSELQEGQLSARGSCHNEVGRESNVCGLTPPCKELQLAEGKNRARCYNLQSLATCFGKFIYVLELPLDLPRRLTIPVVSEERWSKPFAVLSAIFAPVLLAFIWNYDGPKLSFMIHAIGGSIGVISGVVVYFTTEKSNPPRKCLYPWLVGGFLMSIIWTYTLAQEMVALLVSLGLILGVNASVLGLTVLAWGNSLGDLVANVTMAKNGGPAGTQIAISGCYAGPIFNIAVGLGLSLSFSAWTEYPSCYIIDKDPFVYETLAFLLGGLVWALVILPMRKMKLDRVLGGGLLVIYLCFLFLKMARTLGLG
ncbi:unnamed protein product [Ilex paraguariensis]|uniref:Sodium/calcium exchanger membrane region domain-containing protein n=1 Tax=Ilex paraguariensis TaxID=185542 RepID=A0ABC8V4V8_9AQUA